MPGHIDLAISSSKPPFLGDGRIYGVYQDCSSTCWCKGRTGEFTWQSVRRTGSRTGFFIRGLFELQGFPGGNGGGCCFVFVWMFRLKSGTPYFCIYILYIKDTLMIEPQTLSIRSNDCIQPLSRNANNYQRPPSCRCNIPIHVSRVHTARFNWSCSTLSIVSTRKSNKTQ